MDEEHLKRAEITFSVEGDGAQDDNGARFSGVAYSGNAIEQWGQRFAVDLSGIAEGEGLSVPVLLDHRNSIDAIAGKGRIFRARGDGGDELRIEGRLTAATEAGARIATLMSDGFPLRMSIGFKAAFREVEGEACVNGRKMKLDGVFERPEIREVSFVAVPADPGAGVDEVLMCADLEGGADGDPDPAEADRIAGLEAELKAAEERARAAEEALCAMRRETRQAALAEVLAAIGRDDPEDIGPWMEMTDEAFAAAIGVLRDAANDPGKLDEKLFAATSLEKAGGDDGRAPVERLMAAVERIIGN